MVMFRRLCICRVKRSTTILLDERKGIIVGICSPYSMLRNITSAHRPCNCQLVPLLASSSCPFRYTPLVPYYLDAMAHRKVWLVKYR